jgi:hypothetical protein
MRPYSAVVAHQSLRDSVHLIKAQKKKSVIGHSMVFATFDPGDVQGGKAPARRYQRYLSNFN